MKATVNVVAIVFGILAGPAFSADARDILDKVQQKQLERWRGVDMYAVTRSIMGTPSTQYFRRTVVEDSSGETQTFFLPFSPGSGPCDGPMQMTPEMLEQYAAASEASGAALGGELERGGAGPAVDPRGLMGGNAAFLRAAAQAQRTMADEASQDQQASEAADHMAEFFRRARLVGTEEVDGRRAYHLRATDIDQVQDMDGQEFRVDAVSVWIDRREHVQLKMQVEGILKEQSEERPMSFQSLQSDFRKVPNSRMYEPFRQVIQISGALDEEQQAQLLEAQQQLAEMEKEMASMPADQRAMMERMMGGRLDAMRSMVSGGAYEIEMLVSAIDVNPSMTEVAGQPCMPAATLAAGSSTATSLTPAPTAATAAATAAAGGNGADTLTASVQRDLRTLGYDPGTVNGEMTTQTAVAISKFQAANNLEVTGEVTPQLAGILSAKVDAAAGGNAVPAASTLSLEQRQQACLEERIAQAQEAQKKKRGLGRLMRGVSRAASRFGVGRDMSQTVGDVYAANATAEDLSAAAKDLGISEDDIEACRNP